jgi:DNA-binding NarL/FixJ family response regulator
MTVGHYKEDPTLTGTDAPTVHADDLTLHTERVWTFTQGSAVQPRTDTRINVYVVHDQPLIAETLAVELGMQDDLNVVGVAVTTDGVERRIVESHADVVLLAATIGVERLREIICATSATAGILLLATEHDTALLHACTLAGAVGVVFAPRDFTQVATAIRRAHDGWMVLTQQQLADVMSFSGARVSDAAARALCERLSEREREILTVLATGATANDVAEALHISRHTVQSHIKATLRKLNVRSKLAAVVLMVAAGFIDTD